MTAREGIMWWIVGLAVIMILAVYVGTRTCECIHAEMATIFMLSLIAYSVWLWKFSPYADELKFALDN